MSRITRWGFDRRFGAKHRPAQLVRLALKWPQRIVTDAELPGADVHTADKDSGCEAGPAAVSSGAVPGGHYDPANGPECPKYVPRAQRIALPATSAMDEMADKGRTLRAMFGPTRDHGTPAPGKVWCGPCAWHVPEWFGRDCIAGTCPLRVRA